MKFSFNFDFHPASTNTIGSTQLVDEVQNMKHKKSLRANRGSEKCEIATNNQTEGRKGSDTIITRKTTKMW